MQSNKTPLEGWEDGTDWLDVEVESPRRGQAPLPSYQPAPVATTAPPLLISASPTVTKLRAMQLAHEPEQPADELQVAPELPTDDDDASNGPVFPCSKFPEHFPGIFARGGLFSVERLARGKDDEPIFVGRMAVAGAVMTFSGPRLSMRDKELYCELVSRAKLARLRLDSALVVPLSDLAKSLGWLSYSDAALNWMFDAAQRLTRAHVRCKLTDSTAFHGPMLLSATKTVNGLAVKFDPAFALGAFGHGRQFLIDRARSGTLKKPFARWLHDYLSTHTKRQAVDLTYLRKLCGYPPLPSDKREAAMMRKEFPGLLKAAVKDLVDAAPDLCAGMELSKGTKSSDGWTATFTPGSHKPAFEQAEKHAEKAPTARRANL